MKAAYVLAVLSWAEAAVAWTDRPTRESQQVLHDSTGPTLYQGRGNRTSSSAEAGRSGLDDLSNALEVMQSEWYQLWVGTWPTAIDWTAAVLNTLVTSASMSFSKEAQAERGSARSPLALDETVNTYFAHSTAFYFGENAFAIRNQAFDDMLWVVLDWLQNIKFVNDHTANKRLELSGRDWYGSQFIPAFAHRARVFYDLASKGWDERLCGGGMVWNSRLSPYKNAITNQLFISASITMYLQFPGDNIDSPFLVSDMDQTSNSNITTESGLALLRSHKLAAEKGYDWLRNSGMTNDKGLYVDGFHITGWTSRNHTGTGKCDARNNMVYTYNQGVILSGLRGLWEATGNPNYLLDAHELVRSTINATGFREDGEHSSAWSGLGRNGIMEDYCDHRGWCNQDAQLFKGIFFQHLIQLCQPLPRFPRVPRHTHGAPSALARVHLNSCRSYAGWVKRNADAAASTKDKHGRFGMTWGANSTASTTEDVQLAAGAIDYKSLSEQEMCESDNPNAEDINDRGRGRTVETQASGLSVTRAAWEFAQLFNDV